MQIYLKIQFAVTEPVYRREDDTNVLAYPVLQSFSEALWEGVCVLS